MKISASIYSNKNIDMLKLVELLEKYEVDFIHIDCNDDFRVFKDIEIIKKNTKIPIDLHIISERPSKFFQYLKEVDYVTFQYENLKEELNIPTNLKSKIGIAIATNTPIEEFEKFENIADFILFMATTPGESGGKFDKKNFEKIRKFTTRYPTKKIHVDGGINKEIAFILRNFGVHVIVSGSYLVNASDIAESLIKLRVYTPFDYQVKDFMMSFMELPVVNEMEIDLPNVLKTIDDYDMGFCLIVDNEGQFKGIISNGDVRKIFYLNLKDLNKISIKQAINKKPIVAQDTWNVKMLLNHIETSNKTLNFIPVVNNANKLVGAISFKNLIKGELL
ncbi:CBS domain-containing protein [Campylobacter jejuni]